MGPSDDNPLSEAQFKTLKYHSGSLIRADASWESLVECGATINLRLRCCGRNAGYPTPPAQIPASPLGHVRWLRPLLRRWTARHSPPCSVNTSTMRSAPVRAGCADAP